MQSIDTDECEDSILKKGKAEHVSRKWCLRAKDAY